MALVNQIAEFFDSLFFVGFFDRVRWLCAPKKYTQNYERITYFSKYNLHCIKSLHLFLSCLEYYSGFKSANIFFANCVSFKEFQ